MVDKMKHFSTADFDLILTPEGRKKLGKHGVKELIQSYSEAVTSYVQGEPERMFIRGGGNGTTYGHKSDFAIKEVQGQTSFFSVQRMRRIAKLLEQLPHDLLGCVRVPGYYGLYTDKRTGNEYMCMERIDAGMRVQDVMDETAGEISIEIGMAILDDYEKLEAFARGQPEFRSLFTDFHPGNVLVDFSKQNGRKPYTLVIVDQ